MPFLRPACRRCHIRKIKCDSNKPACRPCAEAKVPCQPHERRRRVHNQGNAEDSHRRLVWLEDGISRHLALDIRTIKTGANLDDCLSALKPLHPPSSAETKYKSDLEYTNTAPLSGNSVSRKTRSEHGAEEISTDVTPDISLLTLNATGEMRYLGPSSGSFFAKYASNFARAFLLKKADDAHLSLPQLVTASGGERSSTQNNSNTKTVKPFLSQRILKYLLGCYSRWVHPLYPLLDPSYITAVLEPFCSIDDDPYNTIFVGDYNQTVASIIFLFVLALGAAQVSSSTSDEDEQLCYEEYRDTFSGGKPLSDAIFVRALDVLDSMSQNIPPSIALVQIILLICIYGGYKPSGNGQWQLVGIAIRTCVEIGLHRHRENWNFNDSELDLRRRVFWTAYAAELTVAYNLGRPPSLPDEHIDAVFPDEQADAIMALHHVRHRQIQSKIIAQVYCAPGKLEALSDEEKCFKLRNLQLELDNWKAALPAIFARSSALYPLQYWERLYYSTTAALHRPSPLFPKPSIYSASKCLQSAGKFIDIYHFLLKSTNIPQSWMLLQGLLLSGVTILVTARSNAAQLLQKSHFSLFDIMDWNQKCSSVLTIMSERWSDKSISTLESKFNILASDTVKKLLTMKDKMLLNSQMHPSNNFQERGRANDAMAFVPDIEQAAGQAPIAETMQQDIPQPFEGQSSAGVSDPTLTDSALPTLPLIGSSFQEDLMEWGITDPFPMEGFFGDDDLFTFWDILPDANEQSYPFG